MNRETAPRQDPRRTPLPPFAYRRHPTLRPGDVAVALELVLRPGSSHDVLAMHVHASNGEMINAMRRLAMAGLIDRNAREVRVDRLREFILHGVAYAFPPVVGPVVVGIATGKSVAADDHGSSPTRFVWPWRGGPEHGMAVMPLHPTAPMAAIQNKLLYQLLALVDVLRIGVADERDRAVSILDHWISAPGRYTWGALFNAQAARSGGAGIGHGRCSLRRPTLPEASWNSSSGSLSG